jgi:transcription initiation factor IIE alpha subunit
VSIHDFLAFWGVKMLSDDIKDRLLQKLYYSLPFEEQRRIMVEVLKEMLDHENKCPNCGKKLDEVEK